MGIYQSKKKSNIAILGGGMAGLSLGYYAKKKGLHFRIYEANNRIGGNSVTLKHGDFLFDLGAHRFHDQDEEVTKEIKVLLGEDLKKLNVPSKIYHNDRFIDFPLSPFNLMKNMGLRPFSKAVVDVGSSRLKRRETNGTFEEFALHTYGRTLAESFLLNYSEKLWGISCDRLSPEIAGKRMMGLNLRTFFMEAILGQKAKTKHLDGSFYYPEMGIGTIAKKMGEFSGKNNILINSKITKIFHNSSRIESIEVNGQERIDTSEVISSLPLNILLNIMEPLPPKEILTLAKGLRYRNVILVALFLNKESVTKAATVYFPTPGFPFARIYEPKNRSKDMSPPGKTSLVAEIPSQPEDEIWKLEDEKLIASISSKFAQIGWIRDDEVIDATVKRIYYAYPILEIGSEKKVEKINSFLKGFRNLKVSGRNGRFRYAWIHDMVKSGKEIIEEYNSNPF